jgi:tRNA U34 5-methylaminomethyl-2-thiouridine-forming methyltransferase MnmC
MHKKHPYRYGLSYVPKFYGINAFANLAHRNLISMHTEIKITEDGSATLFVPELKEHYHSIHGAVQESSHVFIRAGLHQLKTRTPVILEIGFGTGLNALLTLMEEDRFERIDYYGVELNPVEWDKIECLSYPSFLRLDEAQKDCLYQMHNSPWDVQSQIGSKFQLTKIKASVLDFNFEVQYDLVYFDAFAPQIQPELWEEQVFKKLFSVMNPEGILVTYCAKGEVRRIMQRCGFVVERLPGPPGKREILRSTRYRY